MITLVSTIARAVFDPIFLIVLYITYLFYKKNVQIEKGMLTFVQKTAIDQMIDATLHGIIAGLIGSLLMGKIGLPLDLTKTSLLLILTAILLSLKNPRFACFSYAAPIVGSISLFIPRLMIDIEGIISLVGGLHLMEAVLVYLTGAKDSIPVVIKLKGKYVGAYSMQKYWPIPIALLTKAEGLIPVCGILGFASIAITSTPEKKARKMGILIGIYATIIIGSARFISIYPAYKFPVLIMMPILHEILYYLDYYFENNKSPIYTAPSNGIRVLDVKLGSYAHAMGIKRGDIICKINNSKIKNAPEYYKILKEGHHIITLNIFRLNGKKEILQCRSIDSYITELGIVPLPTYSVILCAYDQRCD